MEFELRLIAMFGPQLRGGMLRSNVGVTKGCMDFVSSHGLICLRINFYYYAIGRATVSSRLRNNYHVIAITMPWHHDHDVSEKPPIQNNAGFLWIQYFHALNVFCWYEMF